MYYIIVKCKLISMLEVHERTQYKNKHSMQIFKKNTAPSPKGFPSTILWTQWR